MSRINEALKRRSLSEPHDYKVAVRGRFEPLEHEPVLDRYAAESTSAAADETAPFESEDASVPVVETTGEPAAEPRLRAVAEVAVATPPVVAPTVVAPRPVARRELQFDAKWASKLVVTDTASPAAIVQYRRVASSLASWKSEHGGNTLLITSALPREGRTLTAVNLALTLSESFGRRVLLIDGDELRPALHTIFNISSTPGLSDVLRSTRDDVPVVRVSDNLTVLPAGTIESKVTGALTSYRMERVLEGLAASVDWVLLDVPAIRSMPDAGRLSRMAAGVLLVVRARTTPRRVVARAVAQLAPRSIVGTVLNAVAPTTDVPLVAR